MSERSRSSRRPQAASPVSRRAALAAGVVALPALGAGVWALTRGGESSEEATAVVDVCPPPDTIRPAADNASFPAEKPEEITVELFDNSASMQVEPLSKSVFLGDLDDAVRGAYFLGQKSSFQEYESQWGYSTVTGLSQHSVFGCLTDSPVLDIIGTQGAWRGPLTVYVDGRRVGDNLTPAKFDNLPNGLRLSFPHRRFRRIEVIGHFAVRELRVHRGDACGAVWPYSRDGVKTVFIGDSWIDGTEQAPKSIGHLLAEHREIAPVFSAFGGTGYATATKLEQAFTGNRRLGVLKDLDAEIACVFGSINDAQRSHAEIADGAQQIITTLRQKKADLPIILFGGQMADQSAELINGALREVAAQHTGVHLAPVVDIFTEASVGPKDLIHPNQKGAERYSAWLAEQILSVHKNGRLA